MPRSIKATPLKKRRSLVKESDRTATGGTSAHENYNPRAIMMELIACYGDADFQERFGEQAVNDLRKFMWAKCSGVVPQNASQLVRDAFAAFQRPD